MDVRSYASNFLSFSAPIEEAWLEKISDVSKVYIIGEGVTAQEYSHILRRLDHTIGFVSPEQAINKPILLSDGYIIVACYRDREKVVTALENASFIRGKHFETFYKLLRNRAVFDFRGDFDFGEENLRDATSFLMQFPSLGGIDIFVNSSDVTRLRHTMGESLTSLPRDFHVKLSIDIDRQVELDNLASLDVDLIELLVRDKARKHFAPHTFDALCKTASFKQAHVVYIDCDSPVAGDNFSSEAQEYHPPYYDGLLNDDENITLISQQSDTDMCVSRRMYPIFDEKLHFKLCSLYDLPARTNISCLENKEKEYIELRNTLCLQCKQVGIYRKM